MTTPSHILITTADAAQALGLSERRVQQLGRSLHLGTPFGRVRVYSPADVAAMRARSDGRRGGRPPVM